MPERSPRRVFVTGGTGFLGSRVVRALLEQDAEVTALVRPDSEEKLGSLRGRIQWVQGDVWNPASMRGRARGHAVVVHLVGGTRPDPTRGLTFRHLNFVSARNVAQMAVSDGVPHMVLLSASAAPLGVAGGYIDSKRDAEEYLKKTGLTWTIIRAPALYAPGQRRNPIYLVVSLLSYFPIASLILAAHRAMPVDVAARGVASLAMTADSLQNRLVQPGQLRRLGRAAERRAIPGPEISYSGEDDSGLDEPPFGWLPPA
jgi:uncharacterized protein YbjT (DUF2867 family)